MSIQEIWGNFKRFVTDSESVLVILIISVALGSFWLGRLSAQDNMTEKQTSMPDSPSPSAYRPSSIDFVGRGENATSTDVVGGDVASVVVPFALEDGYVASKSGTKYHLPWCSGARRIKEENKVWFATKEEAEAAGYTPAANCKGL